MLLGVLEKQPVRGRAHTHIRNSHITQTLMMRDKKNLLNTHLVTIVLVSPMNCISCIYCMHICIYIMYAVRCCVVSNKKHAMECSQNPDKVYKTLNHTHTHMRVYV